MLDRVDKEQWYANISFVGVEPRSFIPSSLSRMILLSIYYPDIIGPLELKNVSSCKAHGKRNDGAVEYETVKISAIIYNSGDEGGRKRAFKSTNKGGSVLLTPSDRLFSL